MSLTGYKIILPAMLLAAGAAWADGNRAYFLTHGPSAAAYGRGEANTAAVDDAAGMLYNPASLAGLTAGVASVSHFPLMDGTRYNFAGVAVPFKGMAWGLSGVNLRSGEIEIRRNISDTPSTININQWAYGLAVAGRLPAPLSCAVGLNAKYIALDMYGYRATGWGVDAGARRSWQGPRLGHNKTGIHTGISVINAVSPEITLSSEKETYPASYRAGAVWEVPVLWRYAAPDVLSLHVEGRREDRHDLYAAGLEYLCMSRYIVRAGAYADHITMGIGYRHPVFSIDYAMDYSRFALVSKMGMSFYFHRGTKQGSGATGLMKEAEAALHEDTQQRNVRAHQAKALFATAMDSYRAKRYLTAIEEFRFLKVEYPEFEAADQYYDHINARMDRMARGVRESNPEWISYASGFNAYQRKDIVEAMREWEKVLMFNPDQAEVSRYLAQTRSFVKDENLKKQQQEREERISQLFAAGVQSCDQGHWVACIKTMEQVQQACRENVFPGAEDYHARAQGYIEKALKGLSEAVKKSGKSKYTSCPPKSSEPAARPMVDESASDEKYRAGLVLYAQGKTSEAIRLWEIALRMNPDNEKASRAIDRARSEMQ